MSRRASKVLALVAVAALTSAPARAAGAAEKAQPPRPAAAEEKAGPGEAAPIDGKAAAEDALRADIRRLLQLTGAGQLGVQTARQMMASLRPLVPEAPESFWEEFLARLGPDELVERIVPIYARHLSPQDVKDLIAFYESPAGKNLIHAQPAILQESMAAGQSWGREIAMDLLRSARAKGFEVKDM